MCIFDPSLLHLFPSAAGLCTPLPVCCMLSLAHKQLLMVEVEVEVMTHLVDWNVPARSKFKQATSLTENTQAAAGCGSRGNKVPCTFWVTH